MFEFLSWGHVLVIALAALFIFGPQRLPTLAADAGRGVRRLRETIGALRAQLDAEFGEDLGDLRNLDVRQYHPRTFLRAQLLGDDANPTMGTERPGGSPSYSASKPGGDDRLGDRDRGGPPEARVLPPPFDHDAT